jgi:UDP-glucose 4-epimerase
MTSNILITGGLGYIGSHTALDFLLNTDDRIVIVDNCFNSDLSTIQRIQNVSKRNVTFHEGSVGDYYLIIKILKSENIDAVIHFGAAKSVSDSLKDPRFYYENNVSSLMTLTNAVLHCNVKYFIFSSSATVYSQANQFPVNEDGRLGYINPYGQTKLVGEDILLREHQQADLNVGILRYFNPMGNESTGQLGDRLTSSSSNIMPMLYKALQRNKPFFIFGDDYPTYDGTPVRDYIHVNDLASAHRSMLDHLYTASGFHTFNVGLGKGISVLDLVNTFNSVNNLSIQIKYQERRVGDLPICFANINKIHTQLSWDAKYDLDDMCSDAFIFFKKNYL